MQTEMQEIKVAILDLYNNEPNEGMRGIQSILNTYATKPNQKLTWERFDVRFKDQVPDLSYDIYISSGGPGSPLEDVNAQWEKDYFKLIDAIFKHNNTTSGNKKFVFYICHSFQLICRHLNLAEVIKRKSTAFGIFPIHKLTEGFEDNCMTNLPDPFYGVDSRDWQVIQPDHDALKKQGVQLLAIEKYRPHVPYERAIMAIRFNNEMVGTQFHPEADPVGMLHYLMREDKRAHIIENHGIDKYEEMVLHLNDPDKILLTQRTMIPAFLDDAIAQLALVEV
jgi:GMP synthase-like glutamine amidotransferase